MKKEVILAISIGFALGLIITFGIWTANQSLKNLPQPSPKASVSPSPTPSNEVTNNQLTISTPDDEALVSTDTITLSGTATPKATLLIISENGEQTATADTTGNFSLDVDLITGFNTITVYSYSAYGQEASKSLTITYSTAKI
ncbi:MAG: Polymorphic outer membrane protein [Candidatus Amesbacteria bacterium GW2011_GWA1_47_20]|uniref:Polymorphic outer membrane protein n=2 Tax=Candidatus Amesiibacteriota TaxID=1752730 RepID=A0A0G1UUV2_9BACT|nr:MAG: Polymorphic outer membrane protein [Microgenomates group bacterium GW2011_GWC1_46_20]KKU69813.1 MAG: Polymorphic outer membrane protein [Candidatus Amesbacteria bacterium GW2011_GWA1_47_20]KKU84010.1 MAG: Polymorphic outer membrane protein [Candidatus Amesbacteria bacterium GW2011_GWC2_47_8]